MIVHTLGSEGLQTMLHTKLTARRNFMATGVATLAGGRCHREAIATSRHPVDGTRGLRCTYRIAVFSLPREWNGVGETGGSPRDKELASLRLGENVRLC